MNPNEELLSSVYKLNSVTEEVLGQVKSEW